MADFTVDPDYESVQSACDSAVSGDRVLLNAGTATWSSTLSVSNKYITIRGAGIGSTIITDDNGDPPLISYTAASGGLIEISNMTIDDMGLDASGVDHPKILVAGFTQQLRIHSIEFNMSSNKSCIGTRGGVMGVCDHCTFNSAGYICIWSALDNYLNVGNDGHGDYSWNLVESFGTPQAMFYEDNTFVFRYAPPDFSRVSPGFCDGWIGSRVVYRHNTIINMVYTNHGLDSSGRDRSQRQYEIYNNTWSFETGYICDTLIDIGGGVGRVHHNVFNSPGGTINNSCNNMKYLRHTESFSPFGKADGTSPWDQNSDNKGYRAIDQEGVGRGDRLIDFPSPGVPYNQNRGGPYWPRQDVSPTYIWANNNNTGKPLVTSTAGIIENRDWFQGTDPNSVGRPYTPYTYPHPLVSGGFVPSTELPPTSPTPALAAAPGAGVSTIVAGKILVDNIPFFPFGFIHVTGSGTTSDLSNTLSKISLAGFNTIYCAYTGSTVTYGTFLDAAEQAGVRVLTQWTGAPGSLATLTTLTSNFGTKPAVLGWVIADDVDDGTKTHSAVQSAFNQVISEDGFHISLVSGNVPPTASPDIQDYFDVTDAAAIADYPIQFRALHSVATYVKSTVALAPTSNAILAVLQTFNWDGVNDMRFPTAAEIRNMTWQALAYGAKGIIYNRFFNLVRVVTLAWDASADPATAGYFVDYGQTSGVYPNTINAGNVLDTQITIPVDGTWYFRVRNYNSSLVVIGTSTEFSHTWSSPAVLTDLPTAAPTLWTELQGLSPELKAIGAVVLGGTRTNIVDDIANDRIAVYWVYNSVCYVALINTHASNSKSFSFNLPTQFTSQPLRKLFSRYSGTMTLSGATLSGTVAAGDVQVYAITAGIVVVTPPPGSTDDPNPPVGGTTDPGAGGVVGEGPGGTGTGTVNPDGSFTIPLILLPGVNVITLRALLPSGEAITTLVLNYSRRCPAPRVFLQ